MCREIDSTLHLDTSLTDLDFDSRSQVQENKNFCGNYLAQFSINLDGI